MELLWTAGAATALGYWEAATITAWRHALGIPDSASNVLLLTRLTGRFLRIEQARRLCTVAVVGALSILGAHTPGEVILLFGWGLGVWDLAYYGWLRLLVKWPRSLAALDLLFWVIRPWLAPVWIAVSISATVAITCGALLLITLP